ncbi:MAG: hypothetical protein GY759_21185 [Chloroflexi bacterium]|nr:hypothetical protein [Chloroflexota bacterium]
MAKSKITPDIKEQADTIVARFNTGVLYNDPDAGYVTRYRGAFMYLGHEQGGGFWPICRLTYTGDIENWEFAIYKYSNERYDPNDWFFAGSGEIDGSIEGAMRAGLEAYPP